MLYNILVNKRKGNSPKGDEDRHNGKDKTDERKENEACGGAYG